MKKVLLTGIFLLSPLVSFADISGTLGGASFHSSGSTLTIDTDTPSPLQLRNSLQTQASFTCTSAPCSYDLNTVNDYMDNPYIPRDYLLFQDTGGGIVTDTFSVYACPGGDEVVYDSNGSSDCSGGGGGGGGTVYPLAFVQGILFDTASSTCIQTNISGTTTFSCFGTSTSATVPFGDWLLVNCIIIFLLSFIPISMLFSVLKRKK